MAWQPMTMYCRKILGEEESMEPRLLDRALISGCQDDVRDVMARSQAQFVVVNRRLLYVVHSGYMIMYCRDTAYVRGREKK